MIQTKTRTLQLEFADAAGNSVVYSLKNPKEGLDKGTVDAAGKENFRDGRGRSDGLEGQPHHYPSGRDS